MKIIIMILLLVLISGCSVQPCITPFEKEVSLVLGELQDNISFDDERYAEKMELSWGIVAEHYNITESEVYETVFKDIECNYGGK